MNPKSYTKKQRGFTLIELLVVVAIIGLISSVVLSSLASAREKAADAKATQEMHQFQVAVQLFFNENGRYPYPGDLNWHCLVSTGCLFAGSSISGPSGELAQVMEPENERRFTFIKKAEALISGKIGSLSLNPTANGGSTYKGPMYKCFNTSCTQADIIITTKNTMSGLSGYQAISGINLYQQAANGGQAYVPVY